MTSLYQTFIGLILWKLLRSRQIGVLAIGSILLVRVYPVSYIL